MSPNRKHSPVIVQSLSGSQLRVASWATSLLASHESRVMPSRAETARAALTPAVPEGGSGSGAGAATGEWKPFPEQPPPERCVTSGIEREATPLGCSETTLAGSNDSTASARNTSRLAPGWRSDEAGARRPPPLRAWGTATASARRGAGAPGTPGGGGAAWPRFEAGESGSCPDAWAALRGIEGLL